MKKIVYEFDYSAQQLSTISRLSKELNIDEFIVKLLFARGADTKESIEKFLHPSKEHFLNSFLLSGMAEIVKLVNEVKNNNGKILVFGDYDADGVCACSIMHYALKSFGVDFAIYIPERSDGYGLSYATIDSIIEREKPTMFMTVDCGISNAEEIEYIKSKGLLVAVTDHHELPSKIPNCICVNPKFADDYPYDNLCGAGVAFKFATALLGEEAYDLLDLAALATVADSVPLLGENRDIVYEGLQLILNKPRMAFTSLLGKNNTEVTSQTLAFSIAPRVNAAGRVGSARLAYDFFTETDTQKVLEMATKLCELNTERQQRCDEMYLSAKQKLAEKGAYKNVIMLYDDSWSGGFIGIVAARLSEEYNRPVLLFSKKEGTLKGSARSIESINIYEALVNCKEYIEEFGGHSQAAGINLLEENFDKLENAIVEFIDKTYHDDIFIPQTVVCDSVTKPFSMKLGKDLNMLEPYGIGNKKPMFVMEAKELDAQITKDGSTHIQIKNPIIDMMYFNGVKQLNILQSDLEKHIIFEYNLSSFKGKEYLKGFVKEVLYEKLDGENLGYYIFNNNLQALKNSFPAVMPMGKSHAEICNLIKQARANCNYGLCLIASNKSILEKYECLNGLDVNLFTFTSKSLANSVILSPNCDCDFSEFRDIVYLDTPLSFVGLEKVDKDTKIDKNIVYNIDICGYNDFVKLHTEREQLLEVYSSLRTHTLYGNSSLEVALNCNGLDFDINQFVFALEVFASLGLITYEKSLTIQKGRKVNLTSSKLYTEVERLKNI